MATLLPTKIRSSLLGYLLWNAWRLELPFRVCKQFLVCSEVEHFALERKNVTLTLIYKDGCQCGHLLWVPETFILNHTLRNIFTNKFLNMEFYSVERNIY